MALGKESDQQLFNHRLLADDYLAKFGRDLPVSLSQLLDGF